MTERLYRLGRLWLLPEPAVTRRAFGEESATRLDRAFKARNRYGAICPDLLRLTRQRDRRLVKGAGATASELARAAVERWMQPDERGDAVNDLLRVDARLSLADDLLIVADHCAMRSSVELRVPFLDLAMLELVERMPSRYKVSPLGERKWLYRQAAAAPPAARARASSSVRQPSASSASGAFRSRFRSGSAPSGLLAEHGSGLAHCSRSGVVGRRRPGSAGRRSAPPIITRRRSVLYALAQWLDTNRRPAPAAA